MISRYYSYNFCVIQITNSLFVCHICLPREYPCDHVAMLNVTLLHTGCPRISIHETALQMLQLLDKRFFLDEAIVTDGGEEEDGHKTSLSLNEVLLTATYSRSQLYLSEQLARLHPELTIPIFSGKFYISPYSRSQLYLSEQLARLHPELTIPIFSGKFCISPTHALSSTSQSSSRGCILYLPYPSSQVSPTSHHTRALSSTSQSSSRGCIQNSPYPYSHVSSTSHLLVISALLLRAAREAAPVLHLTIVL